MISIKVYWGAQRMNIIEDSDLDILLISDEISLKKNRTSYRITESNSIMNKKLYEVSFVTWNPENNEEISETLYKTDCLIQATKFYNKKIEGLILD